MPYKDPVKQREASTRSARRRRDARKAELFDIFGRECWDCGLADERVLEFHHRDPADKLFGVIRSILSRPWESILEEARKCDLICANCHVLRHYVER